MDLRGLPSLAKILEVVDVSLEGRGEVGQHLVLHLVLLADLADDRRDGGVVVLQQHTGARSNTMLRILCGSGPHPEGQELPTRKARGVCTPTTVKTTTSDCLHHMHVKCCGIVTRESGPT